MTFDVPPASAVADVLALRGSHGWLTPPLVPVVPSASPHHGVAVTIEVDVASSGADFSPMYRLVSGDLTGKVVVVAGAHRVDGCVWGGILATAARASGAVAVLVDGSVRDVDDLARLGTPVYASHRGVVGPNGHATVRAVGGAVEVGGTVVRDGDTVVVDGDGCVVVAADVQQQVLADSARYAAAEARVEEALATGEPLSTAYRYKADVVAVLRG